ncbi:hypothetical protein PF005_g1551 [Phytophthora fragariae]|uniref:Uncharacterized protein n=1 Tax=Phytophthora fragariae TaxID=53985 RepID=A0A6A3ZI36_9STRA|nr:hypothetical protein PF003_g1902 [Phytophthora fragariae]KAE8945963.1 hypothetical protein PF009_g4385 [Phytophthora fragariae]KAE9006476.1 hypothetical protein PF011_g11563 [Phytophthora fragariae]KAE9131407.1 hypothetical protein PF010_g3495 [Phytophthora fragariae]KAE9131504.1 hypothetical protein PF007_g4114 [Phytophthora fragariae]
MKQSPPTLSGGPALVSLRVGWCATGRTCWAEECAQVLIPLFTAVARPPNLPPGSSISDILSEPPR